MHNITMQRVRMETIVRDMEKVFFDAETRLTWLSIAVNDFEKAEKIHGLYPYSENQREQIEKVRDLVAKAQTSLVGAILVFDAIAKAEEWLKIRSEL